MFRKVCVVLPAVLLMSCVHYAPDMKDSGMSQVSSTFFEPLRHPAVFSVRIQPHDASRLLQGKKVPIRLHTLIERNLRYRDLTATDERPADYVIIVEKKDISSHGTAFSKGYSDVMEKFLVDESPYIIEISIEEILINEKGEQVFGKRVALFSTPLIRSEEEIAGDISDSIIERALPGPRL